MQPLDHGLNLLGGILCALRERANLVSNDSETAPVLTRAGRLDGGIERKQVGLFSD